MTEITEAEINPRILVVDDDAQSRELISTKMELVGYEVEGAENGIEALSKAKTFMPDLILLDVMMPLMDGYEALRELKSREETKYIPVIMLTAKTELSDKVTGLELGAEDYVIKPYNLLEVSARVKSFLRVREILARRLETEKMAALGAIVDGIAHEIRNPLVTIGGLARRLLKASSEEKERHGLESIINSVERMEAMVHRVEEYKGVLLSSWTKSDLNQVAFDAAEELVAFLGYEDRNIEIETDLMDTPAKIKMDEMNLRLAVFNILKNAVEATGGGGKIKIETHRSTDEDALYIRVTDTGRGMAEPLLEKIFNPFHTSKTVGAGMGLTITKRNVEDHGGRIKVTSTEGEGSVFTIILPLPQ